MTNEPKWLNEEWCTDNLGRDCKWYQKITTVNAGPDSGKLQWLDWDETNKKFVWSTSEDGHSFYAQPGPPRVRMRTAKTNTSDQYSKLATNTIDCQTQSNIDECNIQHDRGFSDITNSYFFGTWKPCVIPGAWTPSNWNATSNNDCQNDYYNDTNNIRETSWNVGNDGALYNYIDQVYPFVSHGQNFPNEGYPNYFLFGRPDYPAGGWTGTYTGAEIVNSAHGDYSQHWNGCGSDKPAGISLNTCLSDSNFNGPYGPNDVKPNKNNVTWISENTATNCCSQLTSNADAYPQCGITEGKEWNRGAFNPCNSNGVCWNYMNEQCNTKWSECAQGSCSVNDVCQKYLDNNSDQARRSVRYNITDYINSDGRKPHDYISWKLRNQPGSVSQAYYTHHNCSAEPSGDVNSSNPCDRDDSKNPFFIYKLPYLCNTSNPFCPACPITPTAEGSTESDEGTDIDYDTGGSTHESDCPINNPGSPTGRCDDLLHYFCQQFDRSDLEKDNTLLGICGCSLLPLYSTNPYSPPVVEGKQWSLVGQPQSVSPYQANMPSANQCDTLCQTSKILQSSGQCQSEFCMIDNITLNYINSTTGDTTLTQTCGGCGEDGSCQCIMTDITVSKFNSSNTGGVTLSQTCDSCYQTNPDTGQYYPVDCTTGKPIDTSPDQPTPPPPEDEEKIPWYKNKLVIILAIVLLLLIVLIAYIWYNLAKSSRPTPPEIPDVIDPNDAYAYY